MDLNTILSAVPALRHLPDALLCSAWLLIGLNLNKSLEEARGK